MKGLETVTLKIIRVKLNGIEWSEWREKANRVRLMDRMD